MHAIMEAADLMEQAIRTRFGRSWAMHRVLSVIVVVGGRCYIGKAVELSAKANSTMTDILDRAVRLGYITRERGRLGEDRRKIYVVITEEGRRVHDEVRDFLCRIPVPKAVMDYLEEVFKHLPEAG